MEKLFVKWGPCPMYIWELCLITVPAEALAPSSARQSAGEVITTKFDMFSSYFGCLSMSYCNFFRVADIIQNC